MFNHNPHPISFLDSLLGLFLIFFGILVLGYVMLHLLWWIGLITVGVLSIVSGARMRRFSFLKLWLTRRF
jgi:CHASE2 domain-containing sensor protein